jgi:hypothetical protein
MAKATVDRPVGQTFSEVRDWLITEGLSKNAAVEIALLPGWKGLRGQRLAAWLRKEARPVLRAEAKKEEQEAKEEKAAQLLGVKEGGNLAVAVADFQRANKINAGNGVLDNKTMTALLATSPSRPPSGRPAEAAAPATKAVAPAKKAAPVAAPAPAAPAGTPAKAAGKVTPAKPKAAGTPAAQVDMTGDGELMTALGWANAFIGFNPELSGILDKAVAEQWSPETIQAAVNQWSQKAGFRQKQIAWEAEKRLHPVDADAQRKDLQTKLQQKATQIGSP